MSEIVERVAQGVCNVLTRGRRYDMLAIEVWADLDDLQREVWLRLVRHVIAAMRHATPAMMEAGSGARIADFCEDEEIVANAGEIFAVMIDAALEEGE